MIKFYKVGGWVRDALLGIPSKDLDFTVEAPSYDAMKEEIIRRGGEIYLEKPEYFTIRAKMICGQFSTMPADFALARRDGNYSDGRHPDTVSIGTLIDDLSRRDFTMNAIAIAEDGNVIDPYEGQHAIHDRRITCVGKAYDRFSEDSLRMLRAIRFAITKGFAMDPEVCECFGCVELLDKLEAVSTERKREELTKCFVANTMATLDMLSL